jgi:ClpX C4-type zinc finger
MSKRRSRSVRREELRWLKERVAMFSRRKPEPVLNCSFCAKSHTETAFLIAGPEVSICQECVLLCVEMIKKNNERTI